MGMSVTSVRNAQLCALPFRALKLTHESPMTAPAPTRANRSASGGPSRLRDLEIRRARCHELCRTVEASRGDADEVGAADMKYALGRRSVPAHAQLEHNGILPAEDNSWADRQNHRIGGSIDLFEGPDKRAIGPQWMFSAHELDRGLLLVRKSNARETTPRRGRSGRQEQSERERSQADNRSAELVWNDSSSMSRGLFDRDSRSTQADDAVTDQNPTERQGRQCNAGEVQPRDE